MSKSLARVTQALIAAGVESRPIEMPAETRTAQSAADAAGCTPNQIAKSIIFAGASGRMYLFLTAGGNRVQGDRAAQLAGEALGRAAPDDVRRITGFAIGGVAPLGHLTPLPVWMDETLLQFDVIWAAAGTPFHIFPIAPKTLARITQASVARFAAGQDTDTP